MDKIREILSTNPPAGDVYELATVLLGYGMALVLLLVLLILLKHCVESEERFKSTGNANGMGEFELEAFRPLDISTSASVCRSTLPTNVPKSLPYDTRDRFNYSFDTTISELPPSYSVSRADRQ
ncbi:hypothetical protein NX059_002225 [Plenodomus lindquistii]|nr:hypothetical protein NX059_002225 [Plenodomus lindquistii]